MFEIYTHIETLDKLEQVDFSLFDGFYLGDPTCPEYPGNLSHPRNAVDLKKAVELLKSNGKKVLLALYAVPRNKDLEWVKKEIEIGLEAGVDGFEIHNMGILRMANKAAKKKEIHVGYFANIYSHETVKILEGLGVRKVFLNPELSLDEIQYISEHVKAEIVFFAHGKLPLGISESCFIKEYREGNCEDICSPMWLSSGKWRLKNIGRATFSGKDWCTLEYLGMLFYRDFKLFYIQGLRESPEYLTSIARIYREALNKIKDGHDEYIEKSWIDEINELSPYGVCNGYLFRKAGHKYVGKLFGEKIEVRKEV